MQTMASSQQRSHRDASGRSDGHVGNGRYDPEDEDGESRYDAGDAVVFFLLGLISAEDDECDAENNENGGRQDRSELDLQETCQAAQKAGQAEGANTGRSFTGLRLALLPAALNPDQNTDGKSEAETLKRFDHIHFMTIVTSECTSNLDYQIPPGGTSLTAEKRLAKTQRSRGKECRSDAEERQHLRPYDRKSGSPIKHGLG